MSSFLNEKLSTRAKNALVRAQKISRELRCRNIGPEHLLYALAAELSGFAAEVLQKHRVTAEILRLELLRLGGRLADHETWQPNMTASLPAVIEKAAGVAARYRYQFVGTEHLLMGLLLSPAESVKKVLAKIHLNVEELKKNLTYLFESGARFPESAPQREAQRELDDGPFDHSALDYFTDDLTAKAKHGKLDPLVGRARELTRVVSILGRRTKNNPVLIGDPGVGKTAIAEGLAQAIVSGKVPENLQNKRLLALDIAAVVAGSMYRGEFEQRLKEIVDEVADDQDVILFIDEFHTIVGAGAASGSLDAANILKPALSRGELRTIAATTLSEYKKYIEPDAALERRFQPVVVTQPSAEETLQILKGLRPRYESHHRMKISDAALAAAVSLSDRFVPDRFQPDKAIDLMDETAAFYRAKKRGNQGALSNIEQEFKTAVEQKKQAVLDQDFARALLLRKRERKLAAKREKFRPSEASAGKYKGEITALQVAETASRVSGVPAQKIMRREARKLLSLERDLKKRLIGQDDALARVATAIRRSRAGLADAERPIASFIFLGPSGVGKTHLAKLLAEEVFGDPAALVRLDMSEFMERHHVARLTGAPAGYVGYEEGGKLTEALRRRPYCVVLLDEIEKAHPDVMNILLQILDEGILTDAAGRKVNFKNTIIVMTSNIGGAMLKRWARSIGFAEKKEEGPDGQDVKNRVTEALRERFRPEFLNRIDHITVFDPLQKKHIEAIVRLELEKLSEKLAGQGFRMSAAPKAIRHLAEKSFDPEIGARNVRKKIQELVEDPLSGEMIAGKMKPGATVNVELIENKIQIANHP